MRSIVTADLPGVSPSFLPIRDRVVLRIVRNSERVSVLFSVSFVSLQTNLEIMSKIVISLNPIFGETLEALWSKCGRRMIDNFVYLFAISKNSIGFNSDCLETIPSHSSL